MANTCFNRISVSGGTAAEISAFLLEVAGPEGPLDFNVILPVPEIYENIYSGFSRIDGQQVRHWYEETDAQGRSINARKLNDDEIRQLNEIGFMSCYDWKCAHWGCKWNADNVMVERHETSAMITFETPWEPPMPLVEELRERFLGLQITAFFDEPLMLIGGYY